MTQTETQGEAMTANLTDDPYVTDDAHGQGWHLALGDSCERLGELADDSIDLAVYSPPFASLYTYSPSIRDLGNSTDRTEFFAHYGFIISEMLRVTKPGRINAVHVQQLTTTKTTHGIVGLTDFRGEVIRAYQDAGWVFHGEITIDKDPQAQAIRTKAQALMFVQKNKDSSKSRPALADYLLLFRKPGEIAEPVKTDVTNDEWIQWARPIWRGTDEDGALDAMRDEGLIVPQSCWYGIRESNTLNVATAREQADERHICPLQLDLIERAVRLWSNPGETVCSPFAGIGSEGYVSVKLGRQFEGIELKPSYWKVATTNIARAESEAGTATLFDAADLS
jgi:DNA modification methylase